VEKARVRGKKGEGREGKGREGKGESAVPLTSHLKATIRIRQVTLLSGEIQTTSVREVHSRQKLDSHPSAERRRPSPKDENGAESTRVLKWSLTTPDSFDVHRVNRPTGKRVLCVEILRNAKPKTELR
jgi:hypothetical protein